MLEAFEEVFGEQDDSEATGGLGSVDTFLRHSCGINLTLWQRVVSKLFFGEELLEHPVHPYDVSETEWLELMFKRGRLPPDFYDRLTERQGLGFENLNLALGRRSGKTTLIGGCSLYQVRKLLTIPNPQKYYGMQEGQSIIVAVAATSDDQANEMPFGVISTFCREAVNNNRPLARYIDKDGVMSDTIYFLTDHDRELADSKDSRIRNAHNGSIKIRSYHTNQKSLRGGAIIVTIFDEFAWFPITKEEDKGQTFYEALTAAQEQFGPDGKAFTLSSPAYQFGKFHDMFQDAWGAKSPSTLSLQMPSWEAWEFEPDPPEGQRNPKITKKRLADNDRVRLTWDYENGEPWEEAYERAPSSVKREWGAEFEGSENQWLQPVLVDKVFQHNPPLSPALRGDRQRYYQAHMDPSLGGDGFGFGIGHYEDNVCKMDHLFRWIVAPRPEYVDKSFEKVFRQSGREPAHLDTEEILDHIKEMLTKFRVRVLTSDKWESEFLFGNLRRWAHKNRIRTVFRVVNQTRDYNIETAENLRQMIAEDRFKSFEHPLFRQELVRLQKESNGLVQKSPVSTDDLFDVARNIAHQAQGAPQVTGKPNSSRYKVEPRHAQVKM